MAIEWYYYPNGIILPNTSNTSTGHPFKYKDDAERAQAVREFRRKYYKLNKRAICEKNNRYHANQMAGNVQPECTTETVTMKVCPTSKTSDSQIVIAPESKQTTRIIKTQETAICKLLKVPAHLEEVQVGLRGLEGSVLEEMGMTRFYKECKKTIAAIEELWCYGTSGMSGIPDLADRRRQGDLLYETFKFLQSVYEVWFTQWPECDVYLGGDTHQEVKFLLLFYFNLCSFLSLLGHAYHPLFDSESSPSLHVLAVLNTMAPLMWDMAEQEVVLMSMLAEYCTYMPSKNYMQSWPKINWKFFAQWPVHKAYYPDVDDEDELTEKQKEVYKTPLQTRKKQITSWYWWQTNSAHLTCLGGVVKEIVVS
ncbi:hypothetical protein F4604DRAFT_1690253 [Suillus subluteus]|nr:hypothetical protein F4604DRAFT_1690253 [Suillus subluteus]